MARAGWAVAFALGAAAGFCIRGCVSDVPQEREPESRPVVPAPPVEHETTRRAPPVSERESDDEPDSGAEMRPAPHAPGGGDVREFASDDAATGFAEVGVEVLDADGMPAANVFVYALVAGAPGEDDEDTVPHARTADDGRCRLLLASPVTVDVTALGRWVLARAEDVRVPGAAQVRLRLPRAAVARFAFDAERPPGGDVNFSVHSVFKSGMRHLPARGELRSTDSWGGSVGLARPAELPLGPVEFEVGEPPPIAVPPGVSKPAPPPNPAVFEPKRFVPPATIRVRGPDPSETTLAVDLTLDEPKEYANRDRSYAYRLEFEDDAVDAEAWCSWDGPQEPRIVLEHAVRSPTGTLRWSGPRLVSGAARWDVSSSPKVTARIEVRPLTAQSAARVFVDMPREAARDEGRVLLVSRDREYPAETSRALIPVGEEVLLDHAGEWVLVDHEDDDQSPLHRVVAGPVRARSGSLVTLKPRRGGYVVFAPPGTPAEGAGEVQVARSDGAPFPYAQYGSDYHACRAALVPGAVLGPFEPGAVTLDVFVGGVRWGRYEVTVREGVWTTFTPRKFR